MVTVTTLGEVIELIGHFQSLLTVENSNTIFFFATTAIYVDTKRPPAGVKARHRPKRPRRILTLQVTRMKIISAILPVTRNTGVIIIIIIAIITDRTIVAIIMINGATIIMIMINRIGPPAQVNHALPRQIMQKTKRVLGAVLEQRAHRSPRNQNSNGESITHKKTSPHHRMV
ncbi:unnamed protein product [Trichogramma brassicae]|uniref:Uncharacterized protein n=1 Tax=Trichogramma brassicae TaxID=86971 RepID=A0A6H5IY03_9HYME|nr:unnamed protein product [Trichogramma brassicae]